MTIVTTACRLVSIPVYLKYSSSITLGHLLIMDRKPPVAVKSLDSLQRLFSTIPRAL